MNRRITKVLIAAAMVLTIVTFVLCLLCNHIFETPKSRICKKIDSLWYLRPNTTSKSNWRAAMQWLQKLDYEYRVYDRLAANELQILDERMADICTKKNGLDLVRSIWNAHIFAGKTDRVLIPLEHQMLSDIEGSESNIGYTIDDWYGRKMP